MSTPTKPTTPAPTSTKPADGKPATPAPTTGTTRGRKPGQPAKEWSFEGLDLGILIAPQQVSQTLASMAAPMRARDERQTAIDAIVAAIHSEYVGANKPVKWPLMPKRSYHVPPQSADTLRMMVRRAAAYLGVSAKFGSPVRDKDGREIVVFAIRDQREKVARGADTISLTELREFVTVFFGDDTEAAEDFLNALTGEGADEDETDADEPTE